jgi:hypothetical protein
MCIWNILECAPLLGLKPCRRNVLCVKRHLQSDDCGEGKVRKNHPCNRPWRFILLSDFEAPTFSRLSSQRWRWSCQPYEPAVRSLPPGRFLVVISVSGWVNLRDVVRLEGLGQFKNAMTSLGIEGATFLFLWRMMLVSILYLKQAGLSSHPNDLIVNLTE